MNILMLSWEFPPKVVGGLGRHVYELSRHLARKGNQVYLITWGFPGALDYERIEGVEVYRARGNFSAKSFLELALSMNSGMNAVASKLLDANQIDLIHAHDWMVAPAAIELKRKYGLSLMSTIHSTEVGRGGLIHDGYRMTIHELEQALVDSSGEVIVCSKYMRDQVRRLFGYRARVSIIPNGIDRSKFNFQLRKAIFRRRFARDEEKIVLFVGRLVAEKGVNILIEAIPEVLKSMPNVRLIIAGEGYERSELEELAGSLKIKERVTFTGHVDDKTLCSLFRVADLAVFPSLYEPFGIVALEAMAARTPAIVSNEGGFSEIIGHLRNGIKVPRNSSSAIARGIIKILSNPKFAQRLVNRAYRAAINKYDWGNIAGRTMKLYGKARRSRAAQKAPVIPAEARRYHEDEFLWHFYAAGAIDESSAISLTHSLQESMAESIKKAVEMGYLLPQGEGTYYITEKGIFKIFSSFS